MTTKTKSMSKRCAATTKIPNINNNTRNNYEVSASYLNEGDLANRFIIRHYGMRKPKRKDYPNMLQLSAYFLQAKTTCLPLRGRVTKQKGIYYYLCISVLFSTFTGGSQVAAEQHSQITITYSSTFVAVCVSTNVRLLSFDYSSCVALSTNHMYF